VLVIEKGEVDLAKAAKLSEDIEEASKSLQRTNKAFSVMYLGARKMSDITTMAQAEECSNLENELPVSPKQESSHEFTLAYSESVLE